MTDTGVFTAINANKKYFEDLRKKLTEELDQREQNIQKERIWKPSINADSAQYLNTYEDPSSRNEVYGAHFRNQSSPQGRIQFKIEAADKNANNPLADDNFNDRMDQIDLKKVSINQQLDSMAQAYHQYENRFGGALDNSSIPQTSYSGPQNNTTYEDQNINTETKLIESANNSESKYTG